MLKLQGSLLRPGQQARRLDHILDLTTIKLKLSKLVQLRVREFLRVTSTRQEMGPDVAAGGCIEVLVGQRNMNSRFEGRVDVFGPISGEE